MLNEMEENQRKCKIYLMKEKSGFSEEPESSSYLPNDRPDEEIKVITDENGDIAEIIYEQLTPSLGGSQGCTTEILDDVNEQIVRIDNRNGKQTVELINQGKTIGKYPSSNPVFSKKQEPIEKPLSSKEFKRELQKNPLVQDVEPITMEDVKEKEKRRQPFEEEEEEVPITKPQIQNVLPVVVPQLHVKTEGFGNTPVVVKVIDPNKPTVADDLEGRKNFKDELQDHPLVLDDKEQHPLSSQEFRHELGNNPMVLEDKGKDFKQPAAESKKPVLDESELYPLSSQEFRQELEKNPMVLEDRGSDFKQPSHEDKGKDEQHPLLKTDQGSVQTMPIVVERREVPMEEEQIVSPRREILRDEDRLADREIEEHFEDEDEYEESKMKVSTEKARGRIYLGESSLREGMERLFGKKKKSGTAQKRKTSKARDQY